MSAPRVYMEKVASVSFARLKSIAGKTKPLFHMMPADNAKTLLKYKRVMSADEVAARLGKVKMQYAGVKAKGQFNKIKFNKGKASRSILDNFVLREHPEYKNLVSGVLADMSLPGQAGLYRRVRQIPRQTLSGTATIYTSEGMPVNIGAARRYGDIGIMGDAGKLKYPRWRVGGPQQIVEIQPRAVFTQGIIDKVELPTFEGALLYDPQKVPREVAKMFKDKGGIPLNSRFYRLMKALNKQLPSAPMWDPEQGNVAWRTITQRYKQTLPELQRAADDAIDKYIKG
jgi:hypothetical protein